MTNLIRKHIRLAPLVMSIVIVGALAAFLVLANSPGAVMAQDTGDVDPCAGMTKSERGAHLLSGGMCGVPTAEPTPQPTMTPGPEPQAGGFVANAVEGRKVELEWPSVAGATGYEIRFRNLDMAGALWTTRSVSAGTQMYTLEDADLMDGALYEIQLRGDNQTPAEAGSLEILGPVIQFSSETPFKVATGEPADDWRLPRASLAKGDVVRYSIVPSLPKGLSYGQEEGDDHVDLLVSEYPYIIGAVGHTVGGSRQFYRLKGCDIDEGVVNEDSCDTHIFQVIITPATVKPLADVIRDRKYTIGEALNPAHPLNQFPQVGLAGGTGFEYKLLNTEGYQELDLPGLTFNGNTRQLSGTPERPIGWVRVAYRATQPGIDVYHEAEFTITIVEIPRQECRVGLNYEDTLRVYNETNQVGSANFTVRADSNSYYVLPIGEKGQRGAGENRTRTFELITVKKEGGDLSAPNANVLPAGFQVVRLMVDQDSVNPLNDLYTRQGFHMPGEAVTVTPQMMSDDGRYEDPEPDYPETDNGYRLAIGVSDKDMLKEEHYLSCFIVHDTDNDTGETDSSAVVFSLNALPDLSARDWVIELTSGRKTSELDVDQAFTTDAALLNFKTMYVDDDAARNAGTGCIANEAANPKDIVSWTTGDDNKVVFTAKDVTETMTQRVQVTASLKTGGAEACVQVRITVFHSDDQPSIDQPSMLTAPTSVMAMSDAAGMATVSWTPGDNALGHLVLLFNADFSGDPMVGTPTGNAHTFSAVPAGSYIAVVVSYRSVSDYDYEALNSVVTVQ